MICKMVASTTVSGADDGRSSAKGSQDLSGWQIKIWTKFVVDKKIDAGTDDNLGYLFKWPNV